MINDTQEAYHHAHQHMKRALLADDEPNPRFFLSRMLKKSGYSADSCASGEEAYKKLLHVSNAPNHYSLIMSAFLMTPEMNGLELAQKAFELVPHVPFLIITGTPELLEKKHIPVNVVRILSKTEVRPNYLEAIIKEIEASFS